MHPTDSAAIVEVVMWASEITLPCIDTPSSFAASITGVFAIDTSLLPHISNAEASAAIKPWSEALAALENDAEAPLPTIHLSEGVRLTSPPSAGSPDFLGGSSGDPASTRPNGRAA